MNSEMSFFIKIIRILEYYTTDESLISLRLFAGIAPDLSQSLQTSLIVSCQMILSQQNEEDPDPLELD